MIDAIFYVAAPDYTEMSSGRKALHLLCHELNLLGVESYVTCNIVSDKLWTPRLDKNILERHKKSGKKLIAVYPEIEMGNPLLATYVVRWLLNKPNYFGANWFGEFDKNEFIIHYHDTFKPEWIESELFHIGTINREIFNMEGVSDKREGYVLYTNRQNPVEKIPDSVNVIDYISSKNPKTPLECSEIYKKRIGLITFERTAATAEAALCGCPTIFRSHEKFETKSFTENYWKISSFTNYEENLSSKNKGNGDILGEIYDNEIIANKNKLKIIINKINQKFSKIENDRPPLSVLIGHYRILINKKEYRLANELIKELYNNNQKNNEILYLFAENMLINDNKEIAIKLFNELKIRLMKIKHEGLLNKIDEQIDKLIKFCETK